MNNYLIRVEIFGAGPKEHNALNESMKIIDFHRTVRYNSGEIMALPAGTYIGKSLSSAADLRNKVFNLANPLSAKYASIFVCQYNDWSAYLYPASMSGSASES
ncbi:hypothetical protein BDD26_2859 [Xenorhabdus cabanillasii]|uniref:Uncharacterized protein n=1 Tax=Xenorhabdus cabanillasii TaxID=351673 RepID=A0A3D9UPU5_9GAMM|nr:hypothetical protein [Xenorhabdus cabanillasii]REF28004.1 hypothetical protein BDD26_2859 [Xenorhabdus cabanillasii]